MIKNIESFDKAYLYTSTFRNSDGDPVEFKNVVLIRPGFDIIHIWNSWNQAAGNRYTIDKEISIEEALKLPSLPDRLSLASRVELVGDTAQYITHEYEFKYL